jgi:magnesium-transporting ATPase (P-type)
LIQVICLDCPNCGKKIDANANECSNCGSNLSLKPQSGRSVLVRFVRDHFKWSERFEQMIVGLIIGIVSLFFPWSIASHYSVDLPFPNDQLTLNALEFLTANQPLVFLSSSLFIIGIVFSIFNKWFVIVQLIGMIGLSWTMFSYASSALTSKVGPPLGGEYETTGFGLGYLLGWLSLLILGALLIGEKKRERLARRGKQVLPSEMYQAPNYPQGP